MLEITRPSSCVFWPSAVGSSWLCFSVLKDVPLGLASMIARSGAGDDWAATLDEQRVDGGQGLSEAPFVTPATMHFIHLSPSSRSLILRTALGNNFCEEQFFSSSHHSSMSTPWSVCSVNPADYTVSYRPRCGQFSPVVSTLSHNVTSTTL